jgi:WD40 repeat protein/serine/threonine protein kinase
MAASPNRPKDIFLKALDVSSPEEQAAFVAEACGADAALRRQVEAMLRAHAAPDSFLEKPAALGPTIDELPHPRSRPNTGEGPGTRVGPYKLLQQLGEGGMGVVYLAEQQEPVRRLVAIKIIKHGSDSGPTVARFESERQALALMDHPNIARVLDAGSTADGRPYLVMELIKGIPLTRFCDQEHLTPRERLELFLPVCQAIQHAHQKGIIHRDLKPSNVLIALYDGRPVPKVIDFGVAKATGQKLTERTLFTEVGSVVGTLEYMAPEQAELNNLDIDTRADIYALGVLLYELLTGSPPFSAQELRHNGLLEMLRLIREVEPPRPSTRLSGSQQLPAIAASRKSEPARLTSQIQGDLDWIVMKCLEKDRGRRYETANAVAQDIQRYLTDEPVQAGPPGAGYRLRKFIKRNRATVTAAVVVLVTLLAGIAGAAWGWIEALGQRDEARQARQDAKDALALAVRNEGLAEQRRAEAERVARQNQVLAAQEAKARLAADLRREQAETLAVRLQFEHHFAQAGERPDLALVGMASLLPRAERLQDPATAHSLRLHLGVCKGRTPRLQAVWPHTAAAALSADGTTALTAGPDKTARLWDTATGRPLERVLVHHDQVVGVALSADGKIALTASRDGTAQGWNTATGQPLGPPLPHPDQVWALRLSADGKVALTASRDGMARLWAVASGQLLGPPLRHKLQIMAVALSADGTTALTGGYDGTAQAWQTATARPLGPALRCESDVVLAALSADGQTALTATSFGLPQLWNTATGKPLGAPLDHDNIIVAVALSADGKTALTASSDRTARLWEASTGKLRTPPLRHHHTVLDAALSADGKIALTGSEDHTAQWWDAATGQPLGPPLQHRDQVTAVALSADGATAVTACADQTARLWHAAADNLVRPVLKHQDVVYAVSLSADGRIALTGNHDGTAQLWDTATGKPLGPRLEHQDKVIAVALSAGGKTALTGSYDRTAQLWDTATGKPRGPRLQHEGIVFAVALSADGRVALTGSQDNTARLWDAATARPLVVPLRHQGWVAAVALSADGKWALTGSHDKTAQLWATATGKPLGPPLPHQDGVHCVTLSADGKIALTGSQDKTARLWDTATGQPLGPPLQHQDGVLAVALSADGTRAATGSVDKTARVWDTATGQPAGPNLVHHDLVAAVALSANGQAVLTASHDGTARLWESATGKPLTPPLRHRNLIGSGVLSADGKTALTGGYDETARLWQVPQPLRGDPERIKLWSEVCTGLEVDAQAAVHLLDPLTWRERYDRLYQFGGPPAP